MNNDMNNLPYLYGKPTSQGDLRCQPEDFKVYELLPFQASGEGEHLVLYIRKTNQNTVYIAKQLAKFFGVKEALVSYAGLKDRFAVCEQHFSIHLPGSKITHLSDIKALSITGVEVLSLQRHNKKLRTGALLGNRFELTLRNIVNPEGLEKRWEQIRLNGVPNYFGEQRFGIEGANIAKATALFEGKKVKDKKKRGLYLSAARSFLFNHVVAHRIQNNTFNILRAGDVCMLSGTQSVFLAENIDDTLNERLSSFDIDITAPLWGRGSLMTSADILTEESAVVAPFNTFTHGLEHFGLKQERRKIRLTLQLEKMALDDSTLTVSFCLPAGCYATTILRELINYHDATPRIIRSENEQLKDAK